MSCKPNEGAKPGTLHTLRDRVNGRQETFEWNGKSWSTPGTGWGTKWSLMDALGWRYVGPVTDGVPEAQPQQAVQCAFCERPMIAGSECLTADRAAACEVRTTGVGGTDGR